MRNQQDAVVRWRAAISKTAPMTRSLSCSYVSPSSQPSPPSVQRRKASGRVFSFGPGQADHTSPRRPRADRRALTGRPWGSATIAAVSRARWRSLEDSIQLGRRESTGERTGLLASKVGQGAIGVALPAPVTVPVALSVAGKEDRGHGEVRYSAMDLGLRDRVCVVTGSTGASVWRPRVSLLTREQVVVTGRDAERVESARKASGGKLGVVCDLAEPHGPDALVERVRAAVGPIDCLVNNVGVAYQAAFEELSDSQWDECGSST